MPNRTQRRAAERQAQKLAANASKVMLAEQAATGRPETMLAEQAPTGRPETMLAEQAPTGRPETMSASVGGRADQPPPPDTFNFQDLIDEIKEKETSQARRNANRENAQHSTGPRTEEGKAKSSMNAVKTGLTGRTVLLPTDDSIAYDEHLDRHFTEFAPATNKEKALVQTIADTEWRLLRIAPLESGIFAVGRRKLADLFPQEKDPTNRQALIDAEIFMTFRRDFSNLALQERRLRNHLEKDVAQLQALQKDRLDQRKSEIALSIKQGPGFNPADCGFDFSSDELRYYLDRTATQFRLLQTRPDFDKLIAAYRAAQKEPQAA
jgi:hypothetical protein